MSIDQSRGMDFSCVFDKPVNRQFYDLRDGDQLRSLVNQVDCFNELILECDRFEEFKQDFYSVEINDAVLYFRIVFMANDLVAVDRVIESV